MRRCDRVTAWVTGLFVALCVLSSPPPAPAATTSGTLVTSEVWSGVVDITGDVTVGRGASLVIEAGTVVRFLDGTQLRVEGVLRSEGAPDRPVRFTSASAKPGPGRWMGIVFERFSQDTGFILHSVVEYAQNGITCDGASATIRNSTLTQNVIGILLGQSACSPTISGCIIKESQEYGICGFMPFHCAPRIENSHITRCRTGIFLSGGYGYGSPVIRNNIVGDHSAAAIQIEYVQSVEISFNTVLGSHQGIIAHAYSSMSVISSNIIAHHVIGIEVYSYRGSCRLGYNALWGNEASYSGVWPGEGDITVPPLLAGPADYHLLPGSPCIDAGDPSVLDPDGTRSDMGAYGAGGTPPSESGNAPPGTPISLSPVEGDVMSPRSALLTTGPFRDPDPGDTHAASRWQVRKAPASYADAAFDSGPTAVGLECMPIPMGKLEANAAYLWRARHQDSRNGWSHWSPESSFRTPLDLEPPETLILSRIVDGSAIGQKSAEVAWQAEDEFRGPFEFSTALDSEDSWSAFDWSTRQVLGDLSEGSHTFRVRARDASGNVDPTPASLHFTVDTVRPEIRAVKVFQITYFSAVIYWETSEPATSEAAYGQSVPYSHISPVNLQLTTVHTLSLDNLLPSMLYHVSARSADAAGNLTASPDFTFRTTPVLDYGPPETVISMAPDEGSLITTRDVTISWSGLDDSTPPGLLTYSTLLDSGAWSAPLSRSSETLSNLTDGLHTFQVAARDKAGKVDPTPAVRRFSVDSTPPEPPSAFTAQVSLNRVSLQWTPSPSGDARSCRLYWDGGLGTINYGEPYAEVPVSSRSTGVSLPGRGIYTFGLRAVDRAGNEEKNTHVVAVARHTRPDAPTLQPVLSPTPSPRQVLWGTKGSGSSIRLDGMEVIPVNDSTSWTHEIGLSKGLNRFEITCGNDLGEVSPPVQATIEYDPVPPQVSSLRADGSGSGSSVTLSWAGYDEAGQGDIARYRVYAADHPFNEISAMTPSVTAPAGTFTSMVPGLEKSRTTYFAVVAVDARGQLNPSVSPVSAAPADTQPPEDVTSLQARPFVDRLAFTWAPSANTAGDLAGYRVHVNGDDTGAALDPAQKSLEQTGLGPGIPCSVTVKAIDSSGNVSGGVSLSAMTLLRSPTDVTAQPADGKVTLSWTDVQPRASLREYRVYVSQAPFTSVSGMTPRARTTGTRAGAAGLTNGIPCHLAVTAVNADGAENPDVISVSGTPQGDREGPVISDVRFNDGPLSPGAVIRGSGSFTVSAADPAGMSRVEFLMDGALRHTDPGVSSRYAYPWSILSVEDGSHLLAIRACDTLGNVSTITIGLEVAMSPPGAPILTGPAQGTLTNRAAVTVSGSAEKGSEVLLFNNDLPFGKAVGVDLEGRFSSTLTLAEGPNRIQAAARNRGGIGPRSPPVLATLDSTLPESPQNLTAQLLAGGMVRLAWRIPGEATVQGTRLYRAPAPFETPAEATRLGSGLVSGTSWDHLPPHDGTWFFRAATVDSAGNESDLSNTAAIVVDTTPPRALSIQYAPTGPVDGVTGQMGRGLVHVRLTVSEPLASTPFLSITPDGGTPIPVDLSRSTETEYTGTFTISDTTTTGTAHAVFSARDLAGNRGTEIDAGASIQIDASGPSVTQIVLQPGQPVRNEVNSPVAVTLTLGLDEPVAPGTVPELSCLLSARGRAPVEIPSIERAQPLPGQAEAWRGTFTLPADAGLPDVEYFELRFRAADHLGSSGSRILCENRFQVYQGDLPPLESPQGFKALALPGGRIRLSWTAVPGAADYEIRRRGPGESSSGVLNRSGNALEIIDTPPSDGIYGYAAASVRRENGQEAVSAPCPEVLVEVDSIPPPSPRSLSLQLASRGIHAVWQPPPGVSEPVTYALYRADATDITSISGLAPIARDILETSVLDPRPSATDHCYVVTAVDGAGNESEPSNAFYLNFGLLPVSALQVVQRGSEPPVLSWTPPVVGTPGAVAGYHVTLGSGGGDIRLTQGLLSRTFFTDVGFTGDERHYVVTAVDENGVESLPRTLSLPAIQAVLREGETLGRGVMNRLEYTVSSRSMAKVEHIRLKVESGAHSGLSVEFALEPGESRVVPVTFGGYPDLGDLALVRATLSVVAHEGEMAQIVRHDEIEVTDGALLARIESEQLTRGATGTVRFVLQNAGEETIEIVTATGSGGAPSNEIALSVKDLDGNVLSTGSYRQSLGPGVVTLANGITVARIGAGETFTSEPMRLSIPLASPDRVSLQLSIQNIHFHLGRPEHVSMPGLAARQEAALVDTSYAGRVTSVTPQVSRGDREIVIEGAAVDKASGLPVARVPLRLVISVGGFDRAAQVVTDENGAFTHTFKPLPLECGLYKAFAVHPEVLDRPSQATFIINRVSVSPQTVHLAIPRNIEKPVSIQVAAGEGTTARNLWLACNENDQPGGALPIGVRVTPGSPIAELGPRQTGTLGFTVWGDNTAEPTSKLVLRVGSDERGDEAWGTVAVSLQFVESQPVLFFSPNHLETGVSYSEMATESVTLENRGLVGLRDVSLSVVSPDGSPAPSWAHLNSDPLLGDIEVGEKRTVTLSLSPAEEADAEGVFTFHVRVSSSNHRTADVPVFVTVTRSGAGNALFKVSDLYTGTVDARGRIVQGLQGATLTVQNEAVTTIQRTQATDGLGEVLVRDLPAGRYKYRVTAPNHQEHTGRLWIKPGITASEAVFLSFSLVTVEWQVVETTVQDRYEILLRATFEADVPAPVVVADPSSVHLPEMAAGDVYHGEFSLANHGLVRADNVRFSLPPGGEAFRYELLAPVPQSLAARESLTIPFRVVCLRSFNPADDGSATGGGCSRSVQWGRVTYDYVCANGQKSGGAYPYCVIHDTGACAGVSTPSAPTGPATGPSTWSYTYSGGGGTVGPVPSPAPIPIEGARCWPTAARREVFLDTATFRGYWAAIKETFSNILFSVGCSVNTLLREYADEAVDLSVKVPGGSIAVARTFYNNEWQFDHLSDVLEFQWDPLGTSPRAILKGGVVYERSGTASSSPVFVHDTFRIVPTDEGYRWEDKGGNWRSFDSRGRALAYGSRSGAIARILRDPSDDGRITGLADGNGRQVLWIEVDDEGRVLSARDAAGRLVEYGYSKGRLVSVKDVLGQLSTYEYDPSGRLVKSVDPAGRPTFVSYDRYGHVSSVLDRSGKGHFFEYDYDDSRKEYYARIRTSSGRIREVWYDREGDTRRVDVNGRTVLKIVKDGRDLIVIDEKGGLTRKDFDEWGNLTRVVRPDGTRVSFEYEHKFNNMTGLVDPRGFRSSFEYDSRGNLVTRREAVGTPVERTTSYAYDELGQLLTATVHGHTPDENVTTSITYTPEGNLASVMDPEGSRTEFLQYNVMGSPLAIKDARGFTWRFQYDDLGRLTSRIDPTNRVTSYAYDGANNLTGIVNATLKRFGLEYDDHNNRVASIDPFGHGVRTELSSDHLPTRVTDQEGRESLASYDNEGRLLQTVDGAGITTRFHYDESPATPVSSHLPVRVDYPTFSKRLSYDRMERVIGETDLLDEDASQSVSTVYDAAGNVVARTDPEGKITRFEYDALNRLVKVTDASGGMTERAYDARGNLASIRDPNGGLTRIQYDRSHRPVRVIRPMGETTDYEYDAAGNLAQVLDSRGQMISREYDELSRLVLMNHYTVDDPVTPVKTVRFTYDDLGNLTSYSDGTTSGSYTYDDLNRKTGETVDYGPFSLSHSYAYYANGLKKSFTGPEGATYHYTYDSGNRLRGIEIPGQGSITVSDYQWSRPKRVTLPGGTTVETGHDPLMRIKSLVVRDPAGNSLLEHGYAYSASGNLIARTTDLGPYGYQYDRLDRLVQATQPAEPPELYTYDALGNRLTSADVAGVWSYNANNALLGYGSVALEYDPNGNPTRKSVAGEILFQYVHDVSNQLVRVERADGSTVAQYGYDPFGRRLWKEVSGVKTFFAYSDEGLVGEFDASGRAIRSYGYAPGSAWTSGPLFQTSQGKSYWYQNDHLGTPQKLTDTSGRVVWAATYESFGQAVIGLAHIENNLRLPGQYHDAETGLHYNWHRYYDPRTGRYLSTDPLGDGLNPYAYGRNNPLAWVDPQGLCAARGVWGFRHEALTLLGLIPMVGEPADLLDSLFYVLDGEWGDAAMAAAGALPLSGYGSRALQYGGKSVDALVDTQKASDGAKSALKSTQDNLGAARASDGFGDRLKRGAVEWVDENAYMSHQARLYNDSAPGARSNLMTQSVQAPQITRSINDSTTKRVRFDGVDDNVLVDRKLSVVTTAKAQHQALRQSQALRENGFAGRWEVPTAAQARRAIKMFEQLGIDNIAVEVFK